MRFDLVVVLIALLLPASNGYCLEVSEYGYGTLLKGEIEKGDFTKIIEHIKARKNFPHFLISSPGGDVLEAMRIGQFLREAAGNVMVIDYCYSACFFIFVSGVEKNASDDAKVGIHRPYFDKEYFSGLALKEAEKKYKALQLSTKQYLKDMDVPTALLEKMFAASSDDIYFLSPDEVELVSARPPAYDELLKSRCQPLSKKELEDVPYNWMTYKVTGGAPDGMSEGYLNYLIEKIDQYSACFSKIDREAHREALEQYR